MSASLLELRNMALKLYFRYRSELLDLEDYLKLMRPIDDAIDKLEKEPFNRYLADTPVYEISSLKQLR